MRSYLFYMRVLSDLLPTLLQSHFQLLILTYPLLTPSPHTLHHGLLQHLILSHLHLIILAHFHSFFQLLLLNFQLQLFLWLLHSFFKLPLLQSPLIVFGLFENFWDQLVLYMVERGLLFDFVQNFFLMGVGIGFSTSGLDACNLLI